MQRLLIIIFNLDETETASSSPISSDRAAMRCDAACRAARRSIRLEFDLLKEATMKKTSLAVFVSLLALTGTAFAQASSGITESTDPQKAAEVERHAAEIQSKQQASGKEMTSGDSGTAKKASKRTHAKKKAKKSSKAKSAAPENTSGSSSSDSSKASGQESSSGTNK
ncbi:hypothetical protein [Noviherbaspirillum sp.]|uniref:hypothetical protein n=1 Tax=Noviherbaspirillum sp. TaxID=1926288 RepID=UPI002B475EB3|nr:hypothetical protein [Noviherbaspirillum sp.]